MKGFRFLKREEISKIPKTAAVYAFFEKDEFLYIGKATNLRERIKNHFQEPSRQGRDELFWDKVSKIGWIRTDSEIEALILEANLIKKYQPKYNIVWRDDKNYFFVGVTREDFPRIFWTHQTKLKIENCKLKIDYLGPFVDGKALKQTLKFLRKVFPYRSCKTLPKTTYPTTLPLKRVPRACLWYQLSRCPGPCLLKSELAKEINWKESLKKECQRNAKNLMRILQGKRIEVLKNLRKEMKEASEIQNFERAAKIRDQIEALEKVISHAKIFEEIVWPENNWWVQQKVEEKLKNLLKIKGKISRIEAYDVSNIQGKEATGSMITFINGRPDKNFYRKFKIKYLEAAGIAKPNDVAMLKEVFNRRLNHPEWELPDLILVDGGKAQLNATLKIKNQKSKIKNEIKVVSLAKKENRLYIEAQKKPILLKNLSRDIFNLILQLRDEAHRFTLSYHKKLREKNLLK